MQCKGGEQSFDHKSLNDDQEEQEDESSDYKSLNNDQEYQNRGGEESDTSNEFSNSCKNCLYKVI